MMRTVFAHDDRSPRALLCVALLSTLAACGGSEEAKIDLPEASKDEAERSVQVPFAEVERRKVAVPVRATGTTEPLRASDLAPRITSRVQAVLVSEGDQVKKGTPLVRLDANQARLSAAEADARAAQTVAQAKQVSSDLTRLTPLAERGTVPEQRIEQLSSQKDALDAAAEAASVAAKQAKRDVAESVVRAPFDGRVSSVDVEAGEMAVTQPPTILLRLVDLSQIDVRIPVHERDLSRIGVGDAAQVKIPSTGRALTAAVTFIRPEIDPRTRTAEVVVRFDNQESPLLAGMFAEVKIDPSSERTALVVPRAAIGRAGDERFVYVVEQGRARRREVQVQDLDEERVEVLEGVEAGMKIVAGSLDRLSEGVAVQGQAGGGSATESKAADRAPEGEKTGEAKVAERQDAP